MFENIITVVQGVSGLSYIFVQTCEGLFLFVQGRFPVNDYMRTEAGATEDTAHQFAFHGLLSLCSYTAQANLPRNGSTVSGLGPTTSVMNSINALQTCHRLV